MKFFFTCLTAVFVLAHPANTAPVSLPPGKIINHSPAKTGCYIGSPSICIAPNGDYLASHDLFGPKSNEHVRATGRLYRSTDKGATWVHELDFDGFFWTNLFVQKDKIYALGTDKHHGQLIIRRSTDNGETWTAPSVLKPGQWHTAPMPIIEHDGRLWRSFEDAHTALKWGKRYRTRMISAPITADLLNPLNWTFSTAIARNPAWLNGTFNAWLEGNAVVTPEGRVVNILRVATPDLPEKAAIVEISSDGKRATFDPETDFIDYPGGAKKFLIRKDPTGSGYWALANIIPQRHEKTNDPASIRNTLALVYSDDLRTWETRSILLYHPDVTKHAFQYPDWHFDGDDMIAVVRTAFDDAHGGARRAHDANFITFHRWENFRNLTRENDVPMPKPTPNVKTKKLSTPSRWFRMWH